MALHRHTGRFNSVCSWGADVCVAVVLFIFYIISAYPGPGASISPGDAAKFQYAVDTLSAPHAPGYPLYILSGWVWTHVLFFLSPAMAVTFFSGACMCLAVVLLRRTLADMNVGVWPGSVTACAAGAGSVMWLAATEAGPTTFCLALTAVTVWCMVRWYRYNNEKWLGWGLMCAVAGAGHALPLAWCLPFIVMWSVAVRPRSWRNASAWYGLGGGVLLLCAGYTVLYLRSHTGAPLLEYIGADTSLSRLASYALGAQFWDNWWQVSLHDEVSLRLQTMLSAGMREYHYLGILLLCAGLVVAWQRFRSLVWFFVCLIIISVTAVIHLYLPDTDHFLRVVSPAFLLGMYPCGLGLSVVNRISPLLTGVYLACVIGCGIAPRYQRFTREGEWNIERHLLALPPGSTLVTDRYYPLQEVLRYHSLNNSFIDKRNIHLSTGVSGQPGVTNFFLSPGVKEQLDTMNIRYTPVYSNKTAVLYALGVYEEKDK